MRLRRMLAGLALGASLLLTTLPAQAHAGGSKASAMSLKETVDQSGHFGVTIKAWNFTAAPRRLRVAVELSGSGIGTTTTTHDGYSPGYFPPGCITASCYVPGQPYTYTETSAEFFQRYRTVWVTLKVPAYGTNRKRVYGSFADWPAQAEDPFVWGDVVHLHKA